LNFEKILVGLCGSISSGLALAHGASYDHTHSLLESPAIVLCVIVCVGVITAVFKSLKPQARTVPVKADQRRD
jgi:hypothetical protein